jgi:hypothetical protein
MIQCCEDEFHSTYCASINSQEMAAELGQAGVYGRKQQRKKGR